MGDASGVFVHLTLLFLSLMCLSDSSWATICSTYLGCVFSVIRDLMVDCKMTCSCWAFKVLDNLARQLHALTSDRYHVP